MTPATSLVPWDTLVSSDIVDSLVATVTGVLPVVMPILIAVIGIRLGVGLFRSMAK
jgi:hypothetical protein